MQFGFGIGFQVELLLFYINLFVIFLSLNIKIISAWYNLIDLIDFKVEFSLDPFKHQCSHKTKQTKKTQTKQTKKTPNKTNQFTLISLNMKAHSVMWTDSSGHLQAFIVAHFPPFNKDHDFFPVPDARICHSILPATKPQRGELHPWAGKRQQTQHAVQVSTNHGQVSTPPSSPRVTPRWFVSSVISEVSQKPCVVLQKTLARFYTFPNSQSPFVSIW